jgi:hypothetical protein
MGRRVAEDRYGDGETGWARRLAQAEASEPNEKQLRKAKMDAAAGHS